MIWSYDIASAYPYAMTQIPCLQHGRWQRVQGPSPNSLKGRIALIRWRLSGGAGLSSWGPLPIRKKDGNIVFPLSALGGGWVWSPEFFAARDWGIGGHLFADEAWVFRARCQHPPPYAQQIADWYNARLSWSKTSLQRGLTLKLGLNSCYGKSAQRVGRGRFKCMVRAGLITSTCRAMLLAAIGCARDPADVLAVATDGLLSKRRLKLPAPARTGTEVVARRMGKSALGAWEEKQIPSGVFLIRPGMRFELDPESLGGTAARGLGVRVLHKNRQRVLAAWERAPCRQVTLQQPSMFHGAKQTVRKTCRHGANGCECGKFKRDALYGVWTKPPRRKVGYQAGPKRDCIETDDAGGYRLAPWEQCLEESVAYNLGAPSEDGEALEAMRDVADAQPDGGMLETI